MALRNPEQVVLLKKKRRTKYGNKKVVTRDGLKFDSRKEYERFLRLRQSASCGGISDLELQPRFELTVNGIIICTYVADFQYFDCHTGHRVIEDVKGFKTPVCKLKKKLMRAILGVEVKEI